MTNRDKEDHGDGSADIYCENPSISKFETMKMSHFDHPFHAPFVVDPGRFNHTNCMIDFQIFNPRTL
ncbi:hypothetical protein ACFSO7_02475 [Bacillus sp. CGMCC 1.16607]|uniref:hypothetical protein n=1 Tax=Bacillus sp. CGMCC 1.16607 TaxID=3351842 RepID=UPI003638E73B